MGDYIHKNVFVKVLYMVILCVSVTAAIPLRVFGSWVDVDGAGLGQIDASSNTGESMHPSLCLNGSQNPCIAWNDFTYGASEIAYISWNGAAWVDAGGASLAGMNVSDNPGNSVRPSLALDSSGNPHIAWADDTTGNFRIYYLYWNGTAWVDASGSGAAFMDVSSNSLSAAMNPSLKLDSAGNPHIAWDDNASVYREIFYKYWNGSSWATAGGSVNVSNNTGDSLEPSLALDASGNPHISFTNDLKILYLKWNGLAWTDVAGGTVANIIVDPGCYPSPGNNKAWRSSLCLDSAGGPHIAWNGTYYLLPVLDYAVWNGSGWTRVDGTTGFGFVETLPVPVGGWADYGRPSLCLDSLGRPHIACDGGLFSSIYTDLPELYYSYWNGSAWIKNNDMSGSIPPPYNPAGYNGENMVSSLALDSADIPHIAYQNSDISGNEEINFIHWATETPTPIVTETQTATISCTPEITQTRTPADTATQTTTQTSTEQATQTITKTPTPANTVPASATVTLTIFETATQTQVISTPTQTFTPTAITGDEIYAFPNPYTLSKGNIKFLGLPQGSKFTLYTLSGELILTFTSGTGVHYWDGRNAYGSFVSPGVYLYAVRFTDDSKKTVVGKIFIIR